MPPSPSRSRRMYDPRTSSCPFPLSSWLAWYGVIQSRWINSLASDFGSAAARSFNCSSCCPSSSRWSRRASSSEWDGLVAMKSTKPAAGCRSSRVSEGFCPFAHARGSDVQRRLDIISFRGSPARFGRLFRSPLPAADRRHVVAVLADVLLVLDQLLVEGLLEVGGTSAELRQTLDHVLAEMEAVDVVEH